MTDQQQPDKADILAPKLIDLVHAIALGKPFDEYMYAYLGVMRHVVEVDDVELACWGMAIYALELQGQAHAKACPCGGPGELVAGGNIVDHMPPVGRALIRFLLAAQAADRDNAHAIIASIPRDGAELSNFANSVLMTCGKVAREAFQVIGLPGDA